MKLKQLRIKMALSQEEFAKMLGVKRLTVIRWENGTSTPSPLAFEKIKELIIGYENMEANKDEKDDSTD